MLSTVRLVAYGYKWKKKDFSVLMGQKLYIGLCSKILRESYFTSDNDGASSHDAS